MNVKAACLTAACLLGAIAVPDATAGTPGPWVTHVYPVSASVPLSDGCVNDGVANTPQIAVDPLNPRAEAVTYSVGDGAASILARSNDSGRSWTRSPITDTVACDGGGSAYGERFDPDLAFDPAGQLFDSESVQSTGNQSGTAGVNTLVSGPGGTPVPLGPANTLNGLQRGFLAFPAPASTVDVLTEQLGYVAGQYQPFGGTLEISRSQDGGRTWVPSQIYSSPGDDSVVAEGLLAQGEHLEAFGESVAATGLLGDIGITSSFAENAIVLRSDDGGASWSAPQTVFTHDVGSDGVSSCCLLRPASAADGTIYWPDVSAGVLSLWSSADGGADWTQHTITTLTGVSEPTVAVDRNGTVAVSFYALSGSGATQTAAARIAISDDHGQTWTVLDVSQPFRLSGLGPQDDTSALGPVQGLAAIPHGFRAAMTVAAGTPTAAGDGQIVQVSVTRHGPVD